MTHTLDHRTLYRLPWTLSDNALAWLEPTAKCNLACEGCYRANVDEHKSLAQVREDLDVFAKYRNFDSVSIAGGDPLTHPQIIEIVRLIAERGYKPTLNTNGLALDEPLLRELARAGLKAVTFHIDSKQGRPRWKHKTERETNALRLQYAEMVARVGGMLCAFNSTVYEDTLDEVGDLVEWAHEHIDIVHAMILICFREAALEDQFDYYVGDEKVDPSELVYLTPEREQRSDITAPEVVGKIRERYPDFAPCAYLGGTAKPDSFKWLLTSRLGNKRRIYGHLGPKMMEWTQGVHHALTGRYLAYGAPEMMRRGRSMLFGLWPFDGGIRRALSRALTDPRAMLEPMHMQSIVVIQPIDVLPDGRQNMCDGCPDMTVFNGELAWSCRLEECLRFGQFVRHVPRPQASAPRVIRDASAGDPPPDELPLSAAAK